MTMSSDEAIARIFLMSNEDLNRVIEAVKMRRTQLSRSVTRSTMVGDTVKFKGRANKTVTGTVTKVNRKTVQVKDSATGMLWRVSGTLLTPA